MKDATGELNMTLVTIIAIGALLGVFTTVLWPQIKKSLNKGIKNVNANQAQLTYNFDENIDAMFF